MQDADHAVVPVDGNGSAGRAAQAIDHGAVCHTGSGKCFCRLVAQHQYVASKTRSAASACGTCIRSRGGCPRRIVQPENIRVWICGDAILTFALSDGPGDVTVSCLHTQPLQYVGCKPSVVAQLRGGVHRGEAAPGDS